MSSNHKFLDHTADIAVEITADSFGEIIKESLVVFNSITIESPLPQADSVVTISLVGSEREELLVSFLNEINFLLSVNKWVTLEITYLNCTMNDGKWFLQCDLTGCTLPGNSHLKEEIKSVTYHQMEIKELNGKLYTKIVFDI